MDPAITQPHWTAYVAALAVPLTAIIALTTTIITSYIAFQQWQTARRKLKLDLFDRRYDLYVAAKHLIKILQRHYSTPSKDPNIDSVETDDDFRAEVIALAEKVLVADWLVSDDEAVEFLLNLAGHAYKTHDAILDMERSSTTDEQRDLAIEDQKEARRWLVQNRNHLKTIFTPYLKLEH